MTHDNNEPLTTKKLKKLIKQTKSTLNDLQEELDKRKMDNQHLEIDHLEEHMGEVEHGFSNFITFLKDVLKEKK
jgi:DNA-binding transcriptional regulator GbsR (MarR family)